MRRLTDAEFHATFAEPMQRIDASSGPPFDFWPYFDAIATDDFEGFDCSPGEVTYVYRHPEGRYEHVLVDSNDRDVCMALILDRDAGEVVGHKLMNFARLYGGGG